MKKVFQFVAAILLTIFANSCKQSEVESVSLDTVTDSINSLPISSNAAVENKKLNKKFIRTADIKFRVKDVPKSTYVIESAISNHGGFVVHTDLKSNVLEREEKQISSDSILETTRYKIDNYITFRAPNSKLDTILKSLAKEVDFMDARLIKADDVTLKFLANELEKDRLVKHNKRLENDIDSKGKKLNQIQEAENTILEKETEKDHLTLNSLNMEDSVKYSTVTLYIYQRESEKSEVIALPKSIDDYRPSIGFQLKESLRTGWFVLEDVVTFLVQFWSLFLGLIISYWVYKKIKISK